MSVERAKATGGLVQQAVCYNAGRMPAESPVGLSSVHARANICEPRTTASHRTLGVSERKSSREQ
ncbi:hypothetical protein LJC52_03550 [Bacteroidales bacterium OttesenSCG-928-A17]|nr:hypothetical protein [Bacteroidales bacterium OttesenSCG-928-A17]